MEELRNEEILETVGTAVEEVTEAVVEKGGLSLGAKVVGGVGIGAVVVGAIYLGYKFIKNKKAKKNDVIDSNVVAEEDFVETETAE